MPNPTLERLEKEISELEAKIADIDRSIEELEKKRKGYEDAIEMDRHSLGCVMEALGIGSNGSDATLEEPDPSERIHVYDEKLLMLGRGKPKAFWFEGEGYPFETRFRMIVKIMDILKSKDPARFESFLRSDFSSFGKDGIKRLSTYISNEIQNGEDNDWVEYCEGLYVKRIGLREVNTMRIIEILLNYFGIDRNDFYIWFDKDIEPEEENDIDEEDYEEEDPDQLGLDL